MRVALFACALAVAAQAVRISEPVALPEPLELPESDAIAYAESAAELHSSLQADVDSMVDHLVKANQELGQTTSIAEAVAFVDDFGANLMNSVTSSVDQVSKNV